MLDIDKMKNGKQRGRFAVPRKPNMATRHHHAAKVAHAATEPERRWYEILDPMHKPDLHGHLGGVMVHRRGDGQHVLMTDEQARFFLDSGAIRLIEDQDAEDAGAQANADRRTRR